MRNRHGDITDDQAVQTAEAERNRELADLFVGLRPHLTTLITHARAGVEAMPPARHHGRWHLLISDLAHAAEAAERILDEHPDGRDTTSRDAQLWPYLRTWGEHDVLLRDLALQPAHPPSPGPRLTGEEQEWWTARAGHEIAVRLRMLSAQTGHLLQDLTHVGEQLEEAVAVLPPHRTPAPRHLPTPRPSALATTPVAAAPLASSTSAHRR